MSKKTAKKNADELLSTLQQKIAHAHQRAGRASEDEMRRAAVEGEALVALKPFKADGKMYSPGDEITVPAGSRLIPAGYVTTSARWNASKEETALRKLERDVAAPLRSQMMRANYQREQAARAAAEARASLGAAEEAQKAAEAQIARYEAEIAAALDGEV